jgi:ketosteroid isomerase-like protein
MSEQNVETLRRSVEAFNAGDREGLLSCMHPEIEFYSAFEQNVYRGHEGMVRYRDAVDDVLADFHTEDDRFLDAGGDRVVHLYKLVVRGAGSGVPGSRENAILWEFLDGMLFKGRVYLDPDEAFEAAGMRK